MSNAKGTGAIARLLLEHALSPSGGGGVTSPRLAYRAIDLLVAAGEVEAVRELVMSLSYRRLRNYAELRSSRS
jgi:hypothetical protein